MTFSWLGSTVLELVVNTFGIIIVLTAFGPRIGLFAGVAILALTVFGLRMVPGSAKRLERKLQRSLAKGCGLFLTVGGWFLEDSWCQAVIRLASRGLLLGTRSAGAPGRPARADRVQPLSRAVRRTGQGREADDG